MERKRRDERKRRKRGEESKESKSGKRKTRKVKKKYLFQPLFQSLLHIYSLCSLACVRTSKARPATSKAASEALLQNVFCFPFYGELSEQI